VKHKFKGTERYVATEDLMMAVNAAVTLARPLLVKGEPGTGKTQLAEEIAAALDKPLYRWHIKSTTKAQHGLYEYDAVSRLRDSQLGEEKVHDIRNYIIRGTLWEAFASERQVVLLIDEIDKADIEFPNDLLLELDRMEFYVHETRETGSRAASADRRNHQQQREGAARCIPCAGASSTSSVSRCGDDDPHRRCALPGAQARAAVGGVDLPSTRSVTCRGSRRSRRRPIARLAQAAARRGCPAPRPCAPTIRARACRRSTGALLKNRAGRAPCSNS
jgi:hypothetical protein